ncbi:MAG: molybdate ABC transporter substrate-binding protein, partial [Phycisphaerae bacterium]
MHPRTYRAAALAAIMPPFVTACTPTADGRDDAPILFAAASVTDVVTELVTQCPDDRNTIPAPDAQPPPGDTTQPRDPAHRPPAGDDTAPWVSIPSRHGVVVSSGASAALRAQIELGAPCDVFVSADARQVDMLVEHGLADADTRRVLARNRLVIVEPDPNAGQAAPSLNHGPAMPHALNHARYRRIAVANPAYAPAGRYARQALQRAGLWTALTPKLVFADNARNAARHAATAAVDAAIVYATDAAPFDNLTVVHAFPPDAHDPITYVAAAITRAHAHDRARALLDCLAAPRTAGVWMTHGFEPATGRYRDISAGGTGVPPQTASDHPDPDTPQAVDAVLLSIRVSIAATIIMLVPGVLLAVWLARTSSRLRILVDVATTAPLVMPPVVTGVLLLTVMVKVGPVRPYTWWAAVVASAVVSMPLLVRTVRAAVEHTDARLGAAAATLGASPVRVLRTNTLPL